MKYLTSLLLAAFLFTAGASAQTRQPMYVFLYARVTDHINADLSEDRLRRLLPMIETYRNKYPAAHISAAVLFSGATAQALEERNPSTHIVDFVKDYVKRGVIDVGYDGTDEPTYATRPIVDVTKATSPEDRWLQRWNGFEKFLAQGKDPLTGAPQSASLGGLQKTVSVFGEAKWVTGVITLLKVGPGGLGVTATTRARVPIAPEPNTVPVPEGLAAEVGGDTEATIIARRYSKQGIMFGVADDNPGRVPGFRAGRAGFSELISPDPETSPEIFWQDGVLRSSETSGDVIRLLHGYDGDETIKQLVAKANRSKVHVVHIELASERNYLRSDFIKSPNFPALKYAYSHPANPKLPADALAPKTEVDSVYAKEETLLKFIATDFLPSDADSRVVSAADLNHMAGPVNGFAVPMKALQASLQDFLNAWGTDTFGPPIFKANGHYLSRAEMFQVMADALAKFDATGKLPDSVTVDEVYGPIRVLTGHGPNTGEASVASIAHICSALAPALHDKTPGSVPKNVIPIGVSVDGAMLNSAQFLRLMAQALVNPLPTAKVGIRMSYEFTGLGELIPKSRPMMDNGFAWTLKPALLQPTLLGGNQNGSRQLSAKANP